MHPPGLQQTSFVGFDHGKMQVFDHGGKMRENAKREKPTRKTCFSSGIISLYSRIYQAIFCLAAFLGSQRNFFYLLVYEKN